MSEDTDLRSYRIALIADRFVNPAPGELDAVPVLLECGWGLMQLPSESYGGEASGLMLDQVAEQAEEFHRRGYDLVVIGNHPGLATALSVAGVPIPDQIDPRSRDELREFLSGRSAPAAAGRGVSTAQADG